MRSNKIQTLLIVLVLVLGIGYAYINSDLNINGTAQVNSANWDVHWANIAVTTGSVSASTPTISNQTTVNYSVTLNIPGDYYEFTVDAVNGGSIDAMIDTIDSKLNGATITTLPAYLKYSVTYADGGTLQPNHQLLHNTTEKYKVRIEYNADIELNQIPASNQSLSLQFTVTYRQATEAAINRVHHVYTANLYDESLPNNNSVQIGQAIPSGIMQYNTGAEALAALRIATNDNNIQFYFKHVIQDGIVTESYVEFIVTEAMARDNTGVTAGTYAIRGIDSLDINSPNPYYCKAEYYDSSTGKCPTPYYETNRATILSAFGSANCVNNNDWVTICYVKGLSVSADNNRGYIYVYDKGTQINGADAHWVCGVGGFGSSDCSY